MSPDSPRRADWQPAGDDLLLLQALLLPGRPGFDAWRAWSARVALDDVGPAAFRLLPELSRVLREHGVATPDLARLNGVSRKTWYENQLQLAALEQLLQSLSAAGFETLLLRGAISASRGPNKHNQHNIDNLACAVPFDAVPAAVPVLARAGWRLTPDRADPLGHWRFRTSAFFQSSLNNEAIEICWRLIPYDPARLGASGIWQRSQPARLAGQATRVPDVTDQLWMACAEGVVWQAVPDWRWAVDAVQLIQGGGMDWPRLIENCRQCQTTCRVRAALSFIATALEAPVPEAVIGQLQAAAISPAEADFFHLVSRRQGRLGSARKHWRQYCSRVDGRPSPAGFLSYLATEWGFETAGQALVEAGKRGALGHNPVR